MEEEKVVVTGLCPFCGKENPVHLKEGHDGYLLDSKNYRMKKHRNPYKRFFCRGGGFIPQLIIVN